MPVKTISQLIIYQAEDGQARLEVRLDDERLKNSNQPFGYSDEFLRRIQDIRTSEKCLYQKITDIYQLIMNYDPALPVSIDIFNTVQNKLHWAITGKTAASLKKLMGFRILFFRKRKGYPYKTIVGRSTGI